VCEGVGRGVLVLDPDGVGLLERVPDLERLRVRVGGLLFVLECVGLLLSEIDTELDGDGLLEGEEDGGWVGDLEGERLLDIDFDLDLDLDLDRERERERLRVRDLLGLLLRDIDLEGVRVELGEGTVDGVLELEGEALRRVLVLDLERDRDFDLVLVFDLFLLRVLDLECEGRMADAVLLTVGVGKGVRLPVLERDLRGLDLDFVRDRDRDRDRERDLDLDLERDLVRERVILGLGVPVGVLVIL
jgi:hypothetical protein